MLFKTGINIIGVIFYKKFGGGYSSMNSSKTGSDTLFLLIHFYMRAQTRCYEVVA